MFAAAVAPGPVEPGQLENFSVLDERHTVAGHFHFAEQMRIQKNGRTATALVTNDVAHQQPASRVESGGWLVEKNGRGIFDHGDGDTELLPHPFGEIFHALARQKECQILEGHLMPDHVHMFVEAAPKWAPGKIVGLFKAVSAEVLFREFPELRRKLWGGHL